MVEITPPAGTSRRDLFIWYRQELHDDPNFQAVYRQSIATIAALKVGA